MSYPDATIIPDMPDGDYHAHKALSRSALWLFKELPYKYWYQYLSGQAEERKETAALRTGSLIHTMILEPDLFNERYYVMPKVNKATKAGKEAYANAVEKANGRAIINLEEFEMADAMRKSVHDNNVLAKSIITNAKIEHSIFWTDAKTGLELKCRPDIINSPLVGDLKTTANASYREFQLSTFKYGYALQSAMVYKAAEALQIPFEKFVFICVEKTPPYATGLYLVDDEMLDFGCRQLRRLLDDYKQCLDASDWRDYGTNYLTVPKWAEIEESKNDE